MESQSWGPKVNGSYNNSYYIESMGKDLVGVTVQNLTDPNHSCGVNMPLDVLQKFITDLQSYIPEETEDIILLQVVMLMLAPTLLNVSASNNFPGGYAAPVDQKH